MPSHRGALALPLVLALALGCRLGPQPTAGPVEVHAAPASIPDAVALPNADGSLKFAVLGDFGNASRGQYDMATRMAALRETFPYDFVLLVGDNLYGSERPQDFKRKFETPYKALLDAGVKFYGALGNHDAREQRYYELFNMGGELYYTFTPRMFVAGLVQYNSSSATYSANLRFRWEYQPGSEIFVVYTDDRDTNDPLGRWSRLLNRAFVVKINRLFRM